MSKDEMTITVLGTGTSQGVPVIACDCAVCRSESPRDKRLRTAIAVERGSTRVVIDIGPDFRQQMLMHRIDDLDAILITHEHNDHVSGLDEIRPFNYLKKKSLPVYALPRVIGEIRKRFPYIFDDSSGYPGRPDVELHEIGTEMFTIQTLECRPVPVLHGGLPIVGFRFGRFCYITDANHIAEDVLDSLRDLDVLIINALHHERHFSHFNLQEALAMIDRIRPQQAYLTHISHRMGKHANVDGTLPAKVNLAYDGLKIIL